ncbi:pilus assembly protein PilW [Psychromonas marina]|uniref:Pilus assembly protein PilW n=1 Tax=Psychromonas marina TaxID=88364 RepID=A0ABQ6E5X2_9GAMM|nr:PilW family protein [Psychromonas marina]GLS92600.1 pilus assembly protein PilW [Psychromonas marina]
MTLINNKNNRFHSQSGLSLIELMIAIPLSLMVMGTIFKIFVSSMQGVHLQNSFARVQEKGRIGAELIIRDIRGADYWGCARDFTSIANSLNITPVSLGAGVEGIGDAHSIEIDGISVKDETDILTIRGARSIEGVKIETAMLTTQSDISVTTDNTIDKGEILLISDCNKADLFMNTHAATSSDGSIRYATSDKVDGIENTTPYLSKAYTKNAQILSLFSKTYFIGLNEDLNYSLYRSDGGNAEELIRGINDLQLLYGEDTSQNDSVDTFVDATSVTNMDNVRSIKVSLTTEDGEGVAGSPLERTYHITTNIRNRTLN